MEPIRTISDGYSGESLEKNCKTVSILEQSQLFLYIDLGAHLPSVPPRSIARTIITDPMVTNCDSAVGVTVDAASIVAAPIAVWALPTLAAGPDAAKLVVAALRPAAEGVPLLGLL